MVVLGCGSEPAPDDESVTGPVLPDTIAGLSVAGEPEHYDTESIYAYINGHAEVYLAYGMQRCLSQRYIGPDGAGEIVVDLFEMASPSDAFGVYSHDRSGETVPVGNQGVYRHGWLSFWQGSWYGSVTDVSGADEARAAVLAVARAVAGALPEGGEVPELVGRLPAELVDQQTVCYLHSPQVLNAHVDVGSDNPFGLGEGAEAAVGRIAGEGTRGHALVVRYPTGRAAADVDAGLRRGEAGDRPDMLVGLRGALLAAVVGEVDDERAEGLLEEMLRGEP